MADPVSPASAARHNPAAAAAPKKAAEGASFASALRDAKAGLGKGTAPVPSLASEALGARPQLALGARDPHPAPAQPHDAHGRLRERMQDDRDARDEAARDAAHDARLDPRNMHDDAYMSGAHPLALELQGHAVAASVTTSAPQGETDLRTHVATAMEMAAQLVQVRWGSVRGQRAVRFDVREGEHAGAQVMVADAGARTVSLKVSGDDALAERLQTRMRAAGLNVEE